MTLSLYHMILWQGSITQNKTRWVSLLTPLDCCACIPRSIIFMCLGFMNPSRAHLAHALPTFQSLCQSSIMLNSLSYRIHWFAKSSSVSNQKEIFLEFKPNMRSAKYIVIDNSKQEIVQWAEFIKNVFFSLLSYNKNIPHNIVININNITKFTFTMMCSVLHA